jgi:hypothetical protein
MLCRPASLQEVLNDNELPTFTALKIEQDEETKARLLVESDDPTRMND